MNKHPHATAVLLSVLVVFLGLYIIWGSKKMEHPQPVPAEGQMLSMSNTNQNPAAVPSEGFIAVPTSFTIDPKNPDVTTFISNDLGVKFSYINKVEVGQANSQKNPVHTVDLPLPTESGNTISMDGEPIVVFDKNPNVSFADSLKTHFLVGYDAAACYPVVSAPVKSGVETGYQTASIQYPPSGEMGPKPGTCPEQYAMTNAGRYFLYNPAQPDRFLFLNPGQAVTALAPDKQHGFESTVEIIAKK